MWINAHKASESCNTGQVKKVTCSSLRPLFSRFTQLDNDFFQLLPLQDLLSTIDTVHGTNATILSPFSKKRVRKPTTVFLPYSPNLIPDIALGLSYASLRWYSVWLLVRLTTMQLYEKASCMKQSWSIETQDIISACGWLQEPACNFAKDQEGWFGNDTRRLLLFTDFI